MHASYWSKLSRYNRYIEMLVEVGRIEERDNTLVGPAGCTRGGCAESLGAVPKWALGTPYVLCPTHVEAVNADRRLRRRIDSEHGVITPAQGWAKIAEATAAIVERKRLTRKQRAEKQAETLVDQVRREFGDTVADAVEQRMRRTR